MSRSWPLIPLDAIFAIARGGSPRPIDKFITEDPGGINWVMISDATESGKYINSTKKRIREEGAKRSRTVKPGDFLLTNSMSFGRPYIMNTSGCIHDGWLVLSPRDGNVSPDFFYYLLSSDLVYAEFARLAAGATVKNLNIDLVKRISPSPALTGPAPNCRDPGPGRSPAGQAPCRPCPTRHPYPSHLPRPLWRPCYESQVLANLNDRRCR